MCVDPVAARTIEEAKQYNADYQQMVEDNVSDAGLQFFREKTINKLNQDWLYMHKPVNLYGKALACREDSVEARTKIFKGREVTSLGFVYADMQKDDGTVRCRLMYRYAMHDQDTRYYIAADFDDVTMNSGVLSAEYAGNILEYAAPDLRDAIDEAYDGAENFDLAHVQALSTIRVIEKITDNSEDFKEMINASERYVEARLDLETALPYVIDIEGPYWEESEPGVVIHKEQKQKQTSVDTVCGVRFVQTNLKSINGEVSLVYTPVLAVRHYDKTHNGEPRSRFCPFSSITYMSSLRTLARHYEE